MIYYYFIVILKQLKPEPDRSRIFSPKVLLCRTNDGLKLPTLKKRTRSNSKKRQIKTISNHTSVQPVLPTQKASDKLKQALNLNLPTQGGFYRLLWRMSISDNSSL